MALDVFLYTVFCLILWTIETNGQRYFTNNQRYPPVSIPRGYQPPPPPPLRNDYQFFQPPSPPNQRQQQRQNNGNQFNQQQPSHHFQQQQQQQKSQPPGLAPPSFNQNVYPGNSPQNINSRGPPHYPQQQYQANNVHNPPQQNFNTGVNVPNLPPPLFVQSPKPPIVINTLIQVYLNGKNKSIGDPRIEGKIVTGIHSHDRVVLRREFDTKTLTFVEEKSGEKSHNQNDIIEIQGTAVSNSTELETDELAKELEKELENAIPLILEQLDKSNLVNASKDSMMTGSKMGGMEKSMVKKADEDVNIEDLEKLIREGLDQLDDEEAKKQLEKEFKQVMQSSTDSSSSQTTPSPRNKSTIKNDEETFPTTLPPGIVTFVVDIQPIGIAPTASPNEIASSENEEPTTWPVDQEQSHAKTTHNPPTMEPAEMIVPVKAMIAKSQEEENEQETTQHSNVTPEPAEMMMPEMSMTVDSSEQMPVDDRPTAEPAEMIMPVKAMIIESTEDEEKDGASDEEKPTMQPAEMVVPEKAMVIESVEELGPTPEPPEMIMPIKAMIAKSEEDQDLTTAHPPVTAEMIVPQKAMEASREEIESTTTPEPITETVPQTTTETPSTTTIETTTETTSEIITTTMTTIASTTQEETTTSTEPLTTEEITTTLETTTPTTTTAAVKTTITVPLVKEKECEILNDESDTTKGDILFLIDGSTSMGKEQFKKAIQLVASTVVNFNNIGPNGIQVSLVQYNREPYLEFTFRRHNCLSLLLEDINDTEFMNGVSNLGRALAKVMKFAFTPSRGDRLDVENVLVLLSDGFSDDDVQHPITLSRQNGTTPIVVSSLHAKADILMELAEEDMNNVFNLTESLKKPIGVRLAQRIKDLLNVKPSTEKQTDSAVATTTLASNSQTGSDESPEQVEPSLIEMEVTALPISPMLPTNDDSVNVKCTQNGINVNLDFAENYGGTIVAKDHADVRECSTIVEKLSDDSETNRTIGVTIDRDNCGMTHVTSETPKGIQYSIVLNVLHNKEIITAQDKAYIIECFHPTGVTNSTVETELNIEGGLPQGRTISLSVSPPKCRYTLRKDTINGPIVQSARIGQIIYHRWECEGESVTNSVYGLYVHDCKATNTSKNDFEIIDNNGCSTDSTIINQVVYAEEKLLAFAKSYVFTLTDVSTLLFSCKVSLCVRDGDGCEGYSPPLCSNSNMSDVLLTRRVRHYDSALEAALTSELNTDAIDISDPLRIIRYHHLQLPIIVIIVTAIIIGSFMGVIWHVITSVKNRKSDSRHPSQLNFPDDESTTDKSETLSFRSLDFRTGDEQSLDLQEVTSPSPPLSPELRQVPSLSPPAATHTTMN